MNLARILLDSLRLLRREPKAFVPRIITTVLYSAVILALMIVASDVYPVVSHGPGPESAKALRQTIPHLLAILAFMPVLYMIDFISYAMYPRIVADHKAGNTIDLKAALMDALGAWKVLIALGFAVFLLAAVTASAVAASFVLYVVSGNPLPLAVSGIAAIAVTLVFAVTAFFVIPSAVLGRRGIVESFSESFRMGVSNGLDLFKLNLLFLAMIAVTLALANLVNASPSLTAVSFAGFVMIRLMEAVVYAYLSVTNPVAYLEAGSKLK